MADSTAEVAPGDSDAEVAFRLLDGSPDGQLLVGADGRVRVANPAASTMFGYDTAAQDGRAEGLVGRLVEDLVPVEQREPHLAHRRRFGDRPHRRPMGTELSLFAQHRDGEMFPVGISLSPVTLDAELQTMVTIRDVTERQETRVRLRHHEDLHDLVIQRLFAAGMSLHAISGLIESPVARHGVEAVTDDLDETIRVVRSSIAGLGNGDDDSHIPLRRPPRQPHGRTVP